MTAVAIHYSLTQTLLRQLIGNTLLTVSTSLPFMRTMWSNHSKTSVAIQSSSGLGDCRHVTKQSRRITAGQVHLKSYWCVFIRSYYREFIQQQMEKHRVSSS